MRDPSLANLARSGWQRKPKHAGRTGRVL